MVSVFHSLGNIITKYPKTFIALWVIALIVAIPLVGVFNNNLVYDQTKLIPRDMESFVAGDKYVEQFPVDNNTTSITVVVEADNRTRAMHFIDALNGSINGDPAIENVTDTTSIYSIQRGILVNMTPDLYRGLDDGLDNVSKANRELYNGTDGIRNASDGLYYLWDNVTSINNGLYKAKGKIRGSLGQMYGLRDQVVAANDGLYKINDAADLVYGIPAAYAGGFQSAKQDGADNDNASASGRQAAQSVVDGIQDTQNKQLAQNWLNTFDGRWRQQLQSDPSRASDPSGLAQSVINQAGKGFFDGLGLPSQQQGVFDGVLAFGMGGWTNKTSLANNVVNMAMHAQNTTDSTQKAFLMAAYGLGKNPSAYNIDNLVISMIASMSGMSQGDVEGMYRLGRNPSDGAIGNYLIDQTISSIKNSDSGKNMTASDLQNATDMVHDAWNLGGTATKQDYDNYVLKKAGKDMNESEKKNLTTIFGWGPHPNDTVIRDFMFEQIGEGHNASENQTFRDIYYLGRNASNDTLKQYMVSQMIKDMNLTTNASYFLTLLDLPRNMSDEDLKAFARSWVMTHGYDDPKLLPDSATKRLASGNLTLFNVDVRCPSEMNTSVAEGDVGPIRRHIADLLKDPQYSGVKAYVTGGPAMNADMTAASGNDSSTTLTIVLVLVILLLYFRSVLTPFMPLVIIGIAMIAGMGFMGILSTEIGIFYQVNTIMIAIMLGAGTDYCVFMLSRYAEERSRGAETKDSIRSAVAYAGKSIASSGLTAMIGLGSLILVDQGLFRSYGIAGAVSILFSMLVALTLVPAVLTIIGDRIFWPRKIYNSGPGMTTGIWRSITSRVLGHSKLIIVLALLALIPAIFVFTHMQLGTDVVSTMQDGLESKTGYMIMDQEFGSGTFSQAIVVATMPSGLKGADGNYSPQELGQVEEISAMIADTPGVDKVYSMTRPEGVTIRYDNMSSYKSVEKDRYQANMDNNTGRDGRTTLIKFSFAGSPYSDQSRQAIDTVREKLKAYEKGHAGSKLLLGGSNVGIFEYIGVITSKYVLVIPTVLLGIFIVLMLMLRSIFTPLRLIFTLLMSVTWTLALAILVFQYGMHTDLYWIMPIILFCILMGLGVDYDIFLVSRIREEVLKGKSDEEAIKSAIGATGTIITLCGAVMASAFGAMMLSSDITMKQMGFVLFVGIILDATLMRMVVVPSIMVLMKKYNWWMPFMKSEVAMAEEKMALEAAPEVVKSDK